MAEQEKLEVVKKSRKPKNKKKIKRIRLALIGALCLLLAAGGVVYALDKSKQQEVTYSYIRTTTLTKGSLEDSISATGTVESAETSNVTTDLNYAVVSVDVAVGDSVKTGDVICTLDTSELESQIEREKESIEKALSSAQSSYESAQKNYNTAKDNLSEAKSALSEAKSEKSAAYSPYKTALNAIKSYQSAYDSALTAYEKAGAKYVSALNDYNSAVSKYKKGKLTDSELVSSAKAYMKAVQNYYGGCSVGTYDISEDSSSGSSGNTGSDDKSQAALSQTSASAAGSAITTLSTASTISVTETADDICDSVVSQVKSLSGKKVSYSEGSNTLYKLSKRAEALRDAKTQCNYDSLEAAYTTAENAYDAAEQACEQCEDALEQAETQLEDAKEQLSEAGTSDTLEDLESQLEECEIKANQDGTITSLNVTVGSSVSSMNAIATISSMDNLKVSITIAEADINNAEIGMSCYITSDASDEVLNGTLSQMDPVSDNGGSFGAEVTVDSETEALHIGMNASVEIIVSTTEDVFQVPIDAVGNDDDDLGDYVYRQTGGEGTDMTFEKVYVTTGEKNDYYIEISSDDLSEGDVIRATADLTAGVETSSDSGSDLNINFGDTLDGDMPSGGGDMPSGGGGEGRGGGNMPSGGGEGRSGAGGGQ